MLLYCQFGLPVPVFRTRTRITTTIIRTSVPTYVHRSINLADRAKNNDHHETGVGIRVTGEDDCSKQRPNEMRKE